ncbi:hypothetical protein RKD25_001984 [Streptomyces sp. SAI-124]|nr:hypothetical protein [Streptomyces sp. SAI-090]
MDARRPGAGLTRLSDDDGFRLRFAGAMAGIHAVDLVDATFTATFTGSRPSRGRRSAFDVSKVRGPADPPSPTSSRLQRANLG